ncbi:MAG: type 2 isopentenyl-diphosphate Delta-isomerase [Candidatus Eremiobacteraeota bacterium]|nr:type 2 isopentenyl-diphosphate Delta-isomerase [Candidatus Eremiobacteraeota bacterium]
MERRPASSTEARKSRHLDICLDEDVASTLDAGFSVVRLRHEALPEMALTEVNARTSFLGRELRAPLLVSSMTGGTARAGAINRNLAAAAERAGIAIGLGSQRAALEDRALLETYRVRDVAPHVLLFANIGAVQLNYGVTAADAKAIVESIGADGLYLHFNPLQEALQPGGDTNFSGLLEKIAQVVAATTVPVIAKSVGSGISVHTARRLLGAGVAAIDVAGAGGTSWARVEGRRAGDSRRERLAETFAGWGYPTAEATRALRKALPGVPLVASGGVRSGIDVAKAVALGATLCGLAQPLLEPATRSADAVFEALDDLIAGLRIAMFASGCRALADLPGALLETAE